jgi:hypothetical protein
MNILTLSAYLPYPRSWNQAAGSLSGEQYPHIILEAHFPRGSYSSQDLIRRKSNMLSAKWKQDGGQRCSLGLERSPQ